MFFDQVYSRAVRHVQKCVEALKTVQLNVIFNKKETYRKCITKQEYTKYQNTEEICLENS